MIEFPGFYFVCVQDTWRGRRAAGRTVDFAVLALLTLHLFVHFCIAQSTLLTVDYGDVAIPPPPKRRRKKGAPSAPEVSGP